MSENIKIQFTIKKEFNEKNEFKCYSLIYKDQFIDEEYKIEIKEFNKLMDKLLEKDNMFITIYNLGNIKDIIRMINIKIQISNFYNNTLPSNLSNLYNNIITFFEKNHNHIGSKDNTFLNFFNTIWSTYINTLNYDELCLQKFLNNSYYQQLCINSHIFNKKDNDDIKDNK
jgi:hypothetical protein